jgi:predicted site-specific integrase-resolvase
MSELKVRDYAQREGVSERTVRRWIVKGALQTRKTPGGGLRIQDDRPDERGAGRVTHGAGPAGSSSSPGR